MSNNLVIILTGCDSGFGAEIAEDLYRRDGYIIYATCLTQAAVDRYNGLNSDRVRASIVDVTKQADIDALQKLVEKQCPQGVYCLFHNAGVVAGNFLDLSTVENFDNNMQVNYMGLVRLTIAFLPSLRTYAKNRLNTSLPRARLLCTTSIAGRINVRGMAGYCASKQAAESFLDSMRVELSPWEIDVSILEPYNTRTTLIATTASNFERNWKDAPLSTRKMYGLEFRESFRRTLKQAYDEGMPTQRVVDAAVNAIVRTNGCQTRIMIGSWWISILIFLQETLPTKIMDAAMALHMRKTGSWPLDPFLIKDTQDQKTK